MREVRHSDLRLKMKKIVALHPDTRGATKKIDDIDTIGGGTDLL